MFKIITSVFLLFVSIIVACGAGVFVIDIFLFGGSVETAKLTQSIVTNRGGEYDATYTAFTIMVVLWLMAGVMGCILGVRAVGTHLLPTPEQDWVEDYAVSTLGVRTPTSHAWCGGMDSGMVNRDWMVLDGSGTVVAYYLTYDEAVDHSGSSTYEGWAKVEPMPFLQEEGELPLPIYLDEGVWPHEVRAHARGMRARR